MLNATFLLPDGTTLRSCPRLVSRCTREDGNSPQLSFSVPMKTSLNVPESQQAYFLMNTSAPSFGWNGEHAEAWLPYVSEASPTEPSPSATVFVSYSIPDGTSYDWSTGDPPSFKSGQPMWEQYVSQLANPALVNGTDPAAQGSDDGRIFLAGAAAALAGATFATSLDSALKTLRRKHANS